ncbi:MAG: helix-turn-helix domain-containing protein [Chthoniobacterales bacterium]
MKNAHEGQLMLSIGALLAAEREKRGIPVERAAKETRMRPQRIRDMEADDLSHFTNPSYARMFIIAYAKYLGIPMRSIGEHLPDRGESATEGYQYISTSTEDLPSLRHDIASKPAGRNNLLYALATVTLIVVLLAVGGLTYYLVVNASRLTESVNKPPPPPPPAPVREVIVQKVVVLRNVQPDGSKNTAFDQEVEISAPPTPEPGIVTVRKPTPALNTTTAPGAAATPTPESVSSEDQAFLLGSSPELKPVNVR